MAFSPNPLSNCEGDEQTLDWNWRFEESIHSKHFKGYRNLLLLFFFFFFFEKNHCFPFWGSLGLGNVNSSKATNLMFEI